jgi:uncharacterized membrane protein
MNYWYDSLLREYSIWAYFIIIFVFFGGSILCFVESKKTDSSHWKIGLIFIGIFLIIVGILLLFYLLFRNNSNKIERSLYSIRNN